MSTRGVGTLAGDGSSAQPLYRKLRVGRRGRDGPSDEEAASHQRARLQGAMMRAVAVHGYGATTVRELTALAGVSTRTLYELFADGKEECLLSAYDMAMHNIARRVALAYASGHDRERRLHSALQAFTQAVCDDPQAARLVLVEVFAAGPVALERMQHTHRLFESMINMSFRQTTGAPPSRIVTGIVAGVANVARGRLLEGRQSELPALTGELFEWALSYRSPAASGLQSLGSAGWQVPLGAVSAESGKRADDRARILRAATGLAARDGYRTLTLQRICTTAGLSRKCFERHFADVEGCFIAALEERTERALAYAATASAGGRDWPGGLYRALSALCAYLAADPLFARLAFVEVFALGPVGLRCRTRVMTNVAEGFRASAPAARRPSPLVAEASLGAAWGIVHQHVAHSATHRLPQIAAQLSFMALAPSLGAQNAVHAIREEHARIQQTAIAG